MAEQYDLTDKKVVMIIAPVNFRDEEYAFPRKILIEAGVKVDTASAILGPAKGVLGLDAEVDLKVDQIKLADYDGIVMIGGAGSRTYWDNQQVHDLLRQAYKEGKLVGGICSAAVTLARAGVLNGKKATVFSGEAQQLVKAGAIYNGNPVEVDGNVITADGPNSAKDFGRALVEYMMSHPQKLVSR